MKIKCLVLQTIEDENTFKLSIFLTTQHGRPYTNMKLQENAIKLYKRGITQSEISKTLGCSERTVGNYLKSVRDYEKKERHIKMIDLYNEGKSNAEIAKQLNLHESTSV
jgi:DNA-binding CsgD family transcriptional regulator